MTADGYVNLPGYSELALSMHAGFPERTISEELVWIETRLTRSEKEFLCDTGTLKL